MPVTAASMPVRTSNTQRLEQAPQPRAGIIRQDDNLAFVNDTDLYLVPSEPIPFGDSIGVCPKIVKPRQSGTMTLDRVVSFRLNPAEAANINQGVKIYWDYDIDVVDVVQPGQIPNQKATVSGWATATIPTNGYYLGLARIPLAATSEEGRDTMQEDKSPIAAIPPANNIRAVVDVYLRAAEPTIKYGSTPFDGTTLGALSPAP